MSEIIPSSTRHEAGLLLSLALVALWGQLYYAAVPIWRFGEYYTFGWFVPPLAVLLFLRRWPRIGGLPSGSGGIPWARCLLLGLALFPLLVVIRAVAAFDVGWRPALLLQALIVVAATHLILFWLGGLRLALGMLPVTVYALTAMPYPWQFEQWLIRKLTGGVVVIAAELFNLFGRPVAVVGEKLESMGTVVEVSEGCSGIRSFQNLVMAALFFGEFFVLGLLPRITLLGVAILASVAMNTWRAMTLARIRFDEGEAAFHAAHDSVGYLAFIISAFALLMAAKFMSEGIWRRRKLVRTRSVAS